MKIIFLEAVQNHGGARMSTLELAKRMQEIGHEILIVDFWGADPEFNNQVKKYNLDYRIIEEKNTPIILSDTNKLITLYNKIKYLKIQKRYRTNFKEIVNSFSPDIVCVNNLKCLNILESNGTYKIDYFIRTWLTSRNISYTTKFFLKKYKPRFLTVSQSSRQSLYTSGLSKLQDIKVLHSVINDDILVTTP